MDRKELANKVFDMIWPEMMFTKDRWEVWQAIAETDDNSLEEFYFKLLNDAQKVRGRK